MNDNQLKAIQEDQAEPDWIASVWKGRLTRFLVVGAFNTGFSYGLFSLLVYIGLDYKLANLAALIAGILFSYQTQGRLVFSHRLSMRIFLRFFLCWSTIYAFNLLMLSGLIHEGFNAYQAGAIAFVPITILSYLLQRLVVFR